MNQVQPPPITPVDHPRGALSAALPPESKRRTLGEVSLIWIGSLAVMAPWPLLAFFLARSSMDHWREASLLFGGITALPLLVLSALGLSQSAFEILLVVVWCAVATLPVLWLLIRPATRRAIVLILLAQAAFSLAQATLGALMLLTKSV